MLPKKVVPKPYVPKVLRKKSKLEKKADALLEKLKLQKEEKLEKKQAAAKKAKKEAKRYRKALAAREKRQ